MASSGKYCVVTLDLSFVLTPMLATSLCIPLSLCVCVPSLQSSCLLSGTPVTGARIARPGLAPATSRPPRRTSTGTRRAPQAAAGPGEPPPDTEPGQPDYSLIVFRMFSSLCTNCSVFHHTNVTGPGPASPLTCSSLRGSRPGRPRPRPRSTARGCRPPAPAPAPRGHQRSPALILPRVGDLTLGVKTARLDTTYTHSL